MVAAPMLYRDDKIRDIMAMGGKDGYVTALDRDATRCCSERRSPPSPRLPAARLRGVDIYTK